MEGGDDSNGLSTGVPGPREARPAHKRLALLGASALTDDELPHLPETAGGIQISRVVHYEPDTRIHMTVLMDPNNGQVRVDLNGKLAARFFQVELTPGQNSTYIYPTKTVAFGHNQVGAPTRPRFSGTLIRRSTPRPSLCKTLGIG